MKKRFIQAAKVLLMLHTYLHKKRDNVKQIPHKLHRWKLITILSPALFFMVMFSQCGDKNNEPGNPDLTSLTKTYPEETINYFYETVFFGGGSNKLDSISRWQTDVFVYLNGTLWNNDSLYVNNVIDDVNKLNLPVKIALTDDRVKANLHMYFGNYDYVDAKLEATHQSDYLANMSVSQSGSEKRGTIGIANQSPRYSNLSPTDSAMLRQKTITYTIGHCLGVVGRSYNEYESVFFEGHNNVARLSTIDKQLLKLLYDAALPATIQVKEFEKNFGRVLHHINSKEKIIRFVKENNIPPAHLEFMRDHCFPGKVLIKYPKKVFVKLEGNYRQEDIAFCKKTIALINSASKHLELQLEQDDRPHDFPMINLRYNDAKKNVGKEASLHHTYSGLTDPCLIEGKLEISFDRNKIRQKEINEMVGKSFYMVLIGLKKKLNAIETDEHNSPHFSRDFEKILTLIYHPVFPHGFPLSDMQEVIASVKSADKSH